MHADPLARPVEPPRSRATAILVALVVAAAIGAAVWLWFARTAVPVQQSASVPSPAAPAARAPAPEPAIRHPIEQAQVDAAPESPLPALDQSDAAILARLAETLAGTPLERVLVRESVVRKIVATVDNIPRKTVAPQVRAVPPVPGAFAVERGGSRVTLGSANAPRYADLMNVVAVADAKALVGIYVRHYPLFQQAYRELGYPEGYFNDRLVAAIDSLLAAPEVDGALGLAQPRVLYEYADPGLESLPAGQKALLRLGRENEARVKAKLREIRALVASASPR
jgi:hypothetical protein